MNYEVLARKWRPREFDEVVGQEHIKKILKNALINDCLGHAYLFVGTRGVGKTSIARILAKTLNCTNLKKKIIPCHKCGNCREFQQGNFIDFCEIDGASNNSVDDIRELREQVNYNPIRGKYKIFVIDEVHMLTTQAWNALLKVLEEPPAHVKFFFATTEVQKVLPTILSRCQRFDLRPIILKDIITQLEIISQKEKLNISKEALSVIAHIGHGSMRDSLSAFQQVLSLNDGGRITKQDILEIFVRIDTKDIECLFLAIQGEDLSQVFEFFHEYCSKGIDLDQLFYDLIYFSRTVLISLVYKNNIEYLQKFLELEAEECLLWVQRADLFSQEFIQIIIEVLMQEEQRLKQAFNKKLTFELLLNTLVRQTHLLDIEKIISAVKDISSDKFSSENTKFKKLKNRELGSTQQAVKGEKMDGHKKELIQLESEKVNLGDRRKDVAINSSIVNQKKNKLEDKDFFDVNQYNINIIDEEKPDEIRQNYKKPNNE